MIAHEMPLTRAPRNPELVRRAVRGLLSSGGTA